MKYAWIKENRDSFAVQAMCKAMKVSKSGFYSWCQNSPSERQQRSQKIRDDIRKVYDDRTIVVSHVLLLAFA